MDRPSPPAFLPAPHAVRALARRAWLLRASALPWLLRPGAGAAGVNLFRQTYDLSTAELQQPLQRRFPWRRSQPLLGALELTQPVLSPDPARNRLRLALQLALTTPQAPERVFSGIANTSSALLYQAATRSVVLDQPQVEQLDMADLPAHTAPIVARLAAVVVRLALDGAAVHRFQPEDLKVGFKSVEPTAITVTADGVSVGWRWA